MLLWDVYSVMGRIGRSSGSDVVRSPPVDDRNRKKVTETVISVWVWTSHNINEEPCGDGTV